MIKGIQMHKLSVLKVLLFSFFYFSSTFLFSGEPDKILHKKCIYPTFVIHTANYNHGTGVVIRSEKEDYGYVNVALTCAHVVKSMLYSKHYRIVYIKKYKDWSTISEVSSAERIKIHNINYYVDIAVISFVTNEKMPTAEISIDKLYLGNDIFGVGCGLMQAPRLDYGKLTKISPHSYRSSLFTVPGDSGGPVYHGYYLIGLKKAINSVVFQGRRHPTFKISHISPMVALKKWDDDSGNGLEFLYKRDLPIPKLYSIHWKHVILEGKHKELVW